MTFKGHSTTFLSDIPNLNLFYKIRLILVSYEPLNIISFSPSDGNIANEFTLVVCPLRIVATIKIYHI